MFEEIRLITSTHLIPFWGEETPWREGEKIKSNTMSRPIPTCAFLRRGCESL